MRFRRRRDDGSFARATAPLEPRGIYHMSGDARHLWEHSIVEMTATRWSITFRSLAPGGLTRRR
jgi:alkylated DNA repair dioxygenase AlkB